MSSTRAAWKPRSANTRVPASSRRRIVLRPWARNSRDCAGTPGSPDGPVRRDDLYASLMIPITVAEAARRFGDRTAYVTPKGWSLTSSDIDRVSDEAAAGLARRGIGIGDVVALV